MRTSVKTIIRWAVFVLAVAMTTGWFVFCIAYLNRLGWNSILSLDPSDFAVILASVAGPPVALWLVLTVVTQQQEINALSDTIVDFSNMLLKQTGQAEANGRALLELTSASQRLAMSDGLTLILNDLSSSASVVADRTGVLQGDDLELAWVKYDSGDCWSLIRPFIDRASLEEGFSERLKNAILSDLPSRNAAISFVSNIEALQSGALILPEQKLLKKLISQGPLDQVRSLFTIDDLDHETNLDSSEIDGINTQSLDNGEKDSGDILENSRPQPTLFPDN